MNLMVNKINMNIVKENKFLFLILMLELVVTICLTVALLVTCYLKTMTNDRDVGVTITEHKPCNAEEYKKFDDITQLFL